MNANAFDADVEKAEWLEVGAVEAIPRQGARVIAGPEGDIAVFRTLDDRVFALADRCPHRGGPLSQGMVHGHKVTCPLHDWSIQLESGMAVAPDEGCTARFPVRVADGRIWIALAASQRASEDPACA